MAKIQVNEIVDSAGTGAPDFTEGLTTASNKNATFNGNVGVGTSPGVDLDVLTGTNTTGIRVTGDYGNQTDGLMHIDNTHISVAAAERALVVEFSGDATPTTGARYIQFTNANTSDPGSIRIATSGSTTSYTTTSDKRAKENFEELTNGLEVVLAMKPQIFNFKADKDKRRCVGFIAQELFDIYPDAVSPGTESDDDGQYASWGVDYGKVTPVLTKAIQELSAENTELKTYNGQLEDRLATMEARLNALETPPNS
jgi:hypothetical protein